jgi:hypothetical protein
MSDQMASKPMGLLLQDPTLRDGQGEYLPKFTASCSNRTAGRLQEIEEVDEKERERSLIDPSRFSV